MYSLPITVFKDYWRSTGQWSTYVGGTMVLAMGTAVAGHAGDIQAWQLPLSLSKAIIAVPVSDQRVKPAPEGDPGLLIEFDTVVNAAPGAGSQTLAGLRPEGPVPEARLTPSRGGPAVRGPAAPEQAGSSAADSRVDGVAGSSTGTGLKMEDDVIPAPVEYVENDNLLPGMYRLEEAGEPGIRRQVVRSVKVGNQEQSEVLYSFELQAPKKKVVIRNSKPVTGEKFDLSHLKVFRQLQVEATAYTYTGNVTATGVPPRVGLIAVDPRVIPLGTKVYVEGYGYAVAADTGGDIKGNKVDLFFPTLRQCLDWGRRPVRLHVLAAA